MKKRILVYAFLPAVLGLGLVSVKAASAHGFFGGFGAVAPEDIAARHQTMFQEQASVLGISVDEVKSAWAEGKSMRDLAEEKGITQEQLQTKMRTLRETQMKTQLQALVDKGIITQAQADTRLTTMQQHMGNGNKGAGKGKGMGRGMMMHAF
jgi:hypothetical protein